MSSLVHRPPATSAGTSDPTVADVSDRVQQLRQLVRRLEGEGRGGGQERPPVSTGCAALDRLLPQGGLQRGTLVEWLGAESGGGAGTLALAAARQACLAGGLLVVLDRARRFYPPPLAAWGLDLGRVIVVQANRVEDEIWAADQALRCPSVAAVWGPLERLTTRDYRRLQLAAEEGGVLGLLRRPARLLGQPTWADSQWWVRAESASHAAHESASRQDVPAEPGPASRSERRLRVTLVRCRGGPPGPTVTVSWDERTGVIREVESGHETRRVPAVSPLASAAVARRAHRA